ncbi:MAG: hypothetical protein E2O61_13200 [Gammaproteobacteria bacterium]|nr:MAG: hypothetical protein E2O61_13200 [Gammaproteobacteria bacterium]
MLDFFSFLALLAIAYLIWRVTDQLPDLIFRLSEIQRDVAEVRRRLADESEPQQLDSSTTSTVTSAASVDSDV